ncbi:hypothetical protein HMPREF9073_02625 [Capnocytophaga sp. oral taxon 326 str. F0382]|nr:hypothetical protein HMPREF9073_02625 [Capnocytophaga sp. oral taxon 326 str. F0382]
MYLSIVFCNYLTKKSIYFKREKTFSVFFSFLLFRILLPRDNILNNKVFTKIFTKNLTYYLTNKKTLAK